MGADHNQRMTSTAPPAGVLRLTDWGVIRARGADAASFLQGQLTQNVAHLPTGSARLAGYCSAKGRLLASFVVWQAAPDEYLLACSADLLPAVLKRLTMFVLRARCQLSDASADWPMWGAAGVLGGPTPALDIWACSSVPAGITIRLPDAQVQDQHIRRHLHAGGAPAAQPAAPALDIESWRWLEVHSGVARIVAATSEQFVPQMVNFEVVGGIDFQKGCYPGQEVVARSQDRGTIKRRSHVMRCDAPLQPGIEVFDSADPTQPAGMVVLAGAHAGHHAALVEIKVSVLDAVRSGSLHAGSVGGPRLHAEAQPYTLPATAA